MVEIEVAAKNKKTLRSRDLRVNLCNLMRLDVPRTSPFSWLVIDPTVVARMKTWDAVTERKPDCP